jgi:hypothetical protein
MNANPLAIQKQEKSFESKADSPFIVGLKLSTKRKRVAVHPFAVTLQVASDE